MSSANLATLRAAIAAVRADLASDGKESGSKMTANREPSPAPPSSGQRDMSDDKSLLAALDAADKAAGQAIGGVDDKAPRTLKEAETRARQQFAANRKNSPTIAGDQPAAGGFGKQPQADPGSARKR